MIILNSDNLVINSIETNSRYTGHPYIGIQVPDGCVCEVQGYTAILLYRHLMPNTGPPTHPVKAVVSTPKEETVSALQVEAAVSIPEGEDVLTPQVPKTPSTLSRTLPAPRSLSGSKFTRLENLALHTIKMCCILISPPINSSLGSGTKELASLSLLTRQLANRALEVSMNWPIGSKMPCRFQNLDFSAEVTRDILSTCGNLS